MHSIPHNNTNFIHHPTKTTSFLHILVEYDLGCSNGMALFTIYVSKPAIGANPAYTVWSDLIIRPVSARS